MNDMDKEFELYWESHHEDGVLPIAMKKEIRKIAYHAFSYAYKRFSVPDVPSESEGSSL